MKLTQSELTAFLQSIGLASVELVEAQEESEFDKDALLTSVDDNRKQILKPLIEAEVKDATINGLKATAGGSLRSALSRRTGMKRRDLDEFKTDEEAIEAAINYKIGLIDGEKAKVREELDAMLEAHKSEKETITNDYEGKLKAATQRYIDRDIKEFVSGQLKDAPIPKNADRSIIAADFVRHLQDKYHLSYDEATKAAELYTKDKPDMPAMNSAKNAKISILDEAKEFLTPRGLWETDMSGRNPADEMANQQTQGYKQPATKTISLNPNIQDKKADFMKSLKETIQNPSV